MGENLKISYYFVYLEVPNLKGRRVPVYGEYINDFFFARKIKLISLFAVLEVYNFFAVRKLLKPYFSHILIKKCYFIAGHYTNNGKRDNFENFIYFQVCTVELYFTHHFFRLLANFLHIKEVNFVIILINCQPLVHHLNEIYFCHFLGHLKH